MEKAAERGTSQLILPTQYYQDGTHGRSEMHYMIVDVMLGGKYYLKTCKQMGG